MTGRGKRVVFLHPDLGIGGAERLVVDAAVALQVKYCKSLHFYFFKICWSRRDTWNGLMKWFLLNTTRILSRRKVQFTGEKGSYILEYNARQNNFLTLLLCPLKSLGHTVQMVTAHHDPSHCFEETRDGTLDVKCVGDWLPRLVISKLTIASKDYICNFLLGHLEATVMHSVPTFEWSTLPSTLYCSPTWSLRLWFVTRFQHVSLSSSGRLCQPLRNHPKLSFIVISQIR